MKVTVLLQSDCDCKYLSEMFSDMVAANDESDTSFVMRIAGRDTVVRCSGQKKVAQCLDDMLF